MTSLSGKVVLVTGASSGIGRALCELLVSAGAKTIGCARNLDTLNKLSQDLNGNDLTGNFDPIKCDVSNEVDILEMFKFVDEKYGTLHAIVNNAGMAEPHTLLSGSVDAWTRMLHVNILGVAIGCREAVKLMKKSGVDCGHIINVGGMSAHKLSAKHDLHFYSATKFAVKTLTEGLRKELKSENSRIKVTLFSPGGVQTEFRYRMHPDNPEWVKKFYDERGFMTAEEPAKAIMQALQTSSKVNCENIIFVTN